MCLIQASQIAAVADATAAYHEAYIATAGSGRAEYRHKDACRRALENALRALGTLINLEADGNEELLNTTGFPLSKAVISRRKAKEEIGLKESERSVAVTLKGHPEAGGYLLQYTAAPVTEHSEWITVCLTSSCILITGLERETKYAFRVAYVIHDQSLAFSEPVISWYVK